LKSNSTKEDLQSRIAEKGDKVDGFDTQRQLLRLLLDAVDEEYDEEEYDEDEEEEEDQEEGQRIGLTSRTAKSHKSSVRKQGQEALPAESVPKKMASAATPVASVIPLTTALPVATLAGVTNMAELKTPPNIINVPPVARDITARKAAASAASVASALNPASRQTVAASAVQQSRLSPPSGLRYMPQSWNPFGLAAYNNRFSWPLATSPLQQQQQQQQQRQQQYYLLNRAGLTPGNIHDLFTVD